MVYKLTKSFPKEEQFGLVAQMQRAAVAISSNLAEGYARQHKLEYIQSLSIAYASGAELEAQLRIAEKLGYGDRGTYLKIYSLLEEVSKMLNVL